MGGWRYTGDGQTYYTGVPMRDLTAAEFARLAPERQAAVASGVIYEPAPEPEAPGVDGVDGVDAGAASASAGLEVETLTVDGRGRPRPVRRGVN